MSASSGSSRARSGSTRWARRPSSRRLALLAQHPGVVPGLQPRAHSRSSAASWLLFYNGVHPRRGRGLLPAGRRPALLPGLGGAARGARAAGDRVRRRRRPARWGSALLLPGDLPTAASLRHALPSVARMLLSDGGRAGAGGPRRGLLLAVRAPRRSPMRSRSASPCAALRDSCSAGSSCGGSARTREAGREAADAGALVLTPEQVEIRLEPAGAGRRFVALVVDLALVVSAVRVLSQLRCSRCPPALGTLARDPGAAGAELGLPRLLRGAATRGRRRASALLGLRVVDGRGLPLALEQSFVRNVVRVLDALPVVYALGALACLARPRAAAARRPGRGHPGGPRAAARRADRAARRSPLAATACARRGCCACCAASGSRSRSASSSRSCAVRAEGWRSARAST